MPNTHILDDHQTPPRYGSPEGNRNVAEFGGGIRHLGSLNLVSIILFYEGKYCLGIRLWKNFRAIVTVAKDE